MFRHPGGGPWAESHFILQAELGSVIDLHSHILPGVDDGAQTLEEAIAIGRMAEADGIRVMACTPHFMPGVYDNQASDIRARVKHLNDVFEREGLEIVLVTGADAHVRPDFVDCLKQGKILTLHGSRYVLVEPPHHVLPPRLDELMFNIAVSGFVPVLTHPERLKWIEQSYATVQRLAQAGAWMQITAGSLTGRFGRRPQYWAQRMLSEGLVTLLATDAHNTKSRPPLLAEARDLAASRVGPAEAENLVSTRPAMILENRPPDEAPMIELRPVAARREPGFWRRLFGATTQ